MLAGRFRRAHVTLFAAGLLAGCPGPANPSDTLPGAAPVPAQLRTVTPAVDDVTRVDQLRKQGAVGIGPSPLTIRVRRAAPCQDS
jgi:hypothetical protein